MSTSAFTQRAERAPEAQTEPKASLSTLSVGPVGWFGDPLDRFDGRFFDGDQWTNQVSDKGVLRLDPSWTTPSPATSSPLSTADPTNDFAGSERRGSHDRRQITIKVDVERRKRDRRDG